MSKPSSGAGMQDEVDDGNEQQFFAHLLNGIAASVISVRGASHEFVDAGSKEDSMLMCHVKAQSGGEGAASEGATGLTQEVAAVNARRDTCTYDHLKDEKHQMLKSSGCWKAVPFVA